MENEELKSRRDQCKTGDRYLQQENRAPERFYSERMIVDQTPHPIQEYKKAEDMPRKGLEGTIQNVPRLFVGDKQNQSTLLEKKCEQKSVYNIDLEKYNQLMRIGSRVPGTILKK